MRFVQSIGLVSVIVPIYNVEAYLNRCVVSIIEQTYSKLEIILVDDGSSDNCGKMCDAWEKKDERVKVIHKINEGLGYARNSGLDIATGEYVVFIDSDDFIKKEYIELLIERMEKYNSDLVIGGFIRKFESGKEVKNQVTEKLTVINEEDIIEKILLPVIGADTSNHKDVEREMCVWRNMYRMSIINNFNLRFVSEREFVSEDIFFNMMYFINSKKAVLIPECIYYYWNNQTSLTNTYRADRYEKYCKMLKKQTEILQDNNLYSVAKQRMFRTFIMKTKKCINMLSASDLPITKKIYDTKMILHSPILQMVVKELLPITPKGNKQNSILLLMKYKMGAVLTLLFVLKNKRRLR